jgi:hypothetical protein
MRQNYIRTAQFKDGMGDAHSSAPLVGTPP